MKRIKVQKLGSIVQVHDSVLSTLAVPPNSLFPRTALTTCLRLTSRPKSKLFNLCPFHWSESVELGIASGLKLVMDGSWGPTLAGKGNWGWIWLYTSKEVQCRVARQTIK